MANGKQLPITKTATTPATTPSAEFDSRANDASRRPARREVIASTVRAIEVGDLTAIRDAVPGLKGLDDTTAQWTLDGFHYASWIGLELSAHESLAELVGSVLYDLERKKPHRFTRRRFVGFLTAAARIRWADSDVPEEDIAWLVECWPGDGVPDVVTETLEPRASEVKR